MYQYFSGPALVTHSVGLSNVDLYILKDADGHEWTRQRFLHIRCKRKWRNFLSFQGTTDDVGEIRKCFGIAKSLYVKDFFPNHIESFVSF